MHAQDGRSVGDAERKSHKLVRRLDFFEIIFRIDVDAHFIFPTGLDMHYYSMTRRRPADRRLHGCSVGNRHCGSCIILFGGDVSWVMLSLIVLVGSGRNSSS